MKKLYTIAEFTNPFEVKLNLLKDMLEQAGIPFFTTNEFTRTIKPAIFTPSDLSIEVRVYEEDLRAAVDIYRSIQ
ncbi:MAG TPA: DUF2007 domain-containing protein [Prolixibacteraceae bacterium]|nr:DUF2007 domain-containing protein [Prolixibacteraceae bacterium]